MAAHSTGITEKKQELKQDEKAHKAQAKADKLQRKSFDNGKVKKAEKAQDKANNAAGKVLSTSAPTDTEL